MDRSLCVRNCVQMAERMELLAQTLPSTYPIYCVIRNFGYLQNEAGPDWLWLLKRDGQWPERASCSGRW